MAVITVCHDPEVIAEKLRGYLEERESDEAGFNEGYELFFKIRDTASELEEAVKRAPPPHDLEELRYRVSHIVRK